MDADVTDLAKRKQIIDKVRAAVCLAWPDLPEATEMAEAVFKGKTVTAREVVDWIDEYQSIQKARYSAAKEWADAEIKRMESEPLPSPHAPQPVTFSPPDQPRPRKP